MIDPNKTIALVKQEVYQDLYCADSYQTVKETLLSSSRRSGPIGLLNECQADFFIVKLREDTECNIWKQKTSDCGQKPISFYLKFANQINSRTRISQSDVAIDIDSVDWNEYDIVICLDVPFPSSFVKKYPNTLWCYMPGEPCMSIYRRSKKKLVDSYDVFLNQELRHSVAYKNIYFPFNKVRQFPVPTRRWKPKLQAEMDFPYTLASSTSIESLFPEIKSKKGFALEFYTHAEMSQSSRKLLEGVLEFNHKCNGHSIEKRLQGLVQTKYFIKDSTNLVRGNALLEAMASGCLCLSTRKQYYGNYQKLLSSRGNFRNMKDLTAFIDDLERNEELYEYHKKEQDSRMNKYCFEEPLERLFLTHDLLISKNR